MASMEFFEEGAARELSAAKGQRDECVRASLALTALFDGEASEAEAKLARQHLESCARCAMLWQSWTRYRFLMHRLPVPATPPALLTRILLAVRLMNLARPGTVAPLARPHEAAPSSAQAHDARLLSEVVWLSGADPFAPRRGTRKAAARIEAPRELPPLDPLAPQPPAGLRDEILRRTIGATAPAPVAEVVEPQVAVVAKLRHGWNFSTLLMPALAAWLIFISNGWQTFAPAPRVAKSSNAVTRPVQNIAKRTAKVFAPRMVRDSVPETVVVNAANTVKEEAARVESTTDETALQILPLIGSEEATPGTEETPAAPSATPAATPLPSSAPVVKAAPKVTAIATVHRPAITAAELDLRPRRADWSAPQPAVSAARQGEWAAIADDRVAAPPAPDTTVETGNDGAAAEGLEHVSRLSDDRPDDVRSVLDEFRTSLLTAKAEDDAPATGNDG